MIFRAKTTEQELAQLQNKRKSLSEKLAASRAEAEAAMTARRAWLLGDATDDKQRKAVDARVVAAQSAELGLEDALAELDRKIADAKQRLDDENEKIAREKSAGELNTKAAELERKREVARIANLELSEVIDAMPVLPYENPDFRPRVKALLVEVPAAVGQFVDDIRSHAARISSGQEPYPGQPAKVEAPPEPPKLNDKSSGTFYGKFGRAPGETFIGDSV